MEHGKREWLLRWSGELAPRKESLRAEPIHRIRRLAPFSQLQAHTATDHRLQFTDYRPPNPPMTPRAISLSPASSIMHGMVRVGLRGSQAHATIRSAKSEGKSIFVKQIDFLDSFSSLNGKTTHAIVSNMSEEDIYRLEVWFSGTVQGVGFRYKTTQVAKGYDITGMVKNLSDGRVYLVAEGEEDEVRAFCNDLNKNMVSFIKEQQEQECRGPRQYRGFTIGG